MKRTSNTYHIISFFIKLAIIYVVAWSLTKLFTPKDENTKHRSEHGQVSVQMLA